MKQHLIILLSFGLLLTSCSKKENPLLPATGNSFVDSAFNYLNAHLSPEELTPLSTKDYVIIPYHNSNRFLLLYYKTAGRSLLLEKTAEGFNGNLIKMNFEDPEKKNGSLLTEDMITKKGHKISFTNGTVARIEPTTEGRINNYAVSHSTITPAVAIIPLKTEDVVIEIYISASGGGSHGVNLSSLYYFTNFNDSYFYSYTTAPLFYPSSGGGGGVNTGSSSTATVVDIPMLPGATKPININKELECFTLTAGATYSMRINVNQPEPNTRTIVNTSAEHKVGHTYITLEQKNPDGSVISRNIGWYPADFIKPSDGLENGVYQDDTQTPYSVSMTVSVSPAEFMIAKNYLSSIKQYGLQDANCTTIGINAFEKANIHLPKTIGTLYGPSNSYTPLPAQKPILFRGVNPGDLGQDIRGMNASVFSRNNGGRSVTIDKYNNNNKTRSRSGKCN